MKAELSKHPSPVDQLITCQGFSFVRNREAGIRRTKSYPLTGVDSEQAPQSIVFVFLFLCLFVVPRQGNSGEAEPSSEADR